MLNALADEQWRHPEMLNASTNNAVIPKLNAPMEGRHPDRSRFSGEGRDLARRPGKSTAPCDI